MPPQQHLLRDRKERTNGNAPGITLPPMPRNTAGRRKPLNNNTSHLRVADQTLFGYREGVISKNPRAKQAVAKFPERFAARRKELKLSQAQLAKLTGIGRSTIESWTRSSIRHIPSLEALVITAEILQTSVDYLLGLTDNPTPTNRLAAALEGIANTNTT